MKIHAPRRRFSDRAHPRPGRDTGAARDRLAKGMAEAAAGHTKPLTRADVLALQRIVGNRAVLRLMNGGVTSVQRVMSRSMLREEKEARRPKNVEVNLGEFAPFAAERREDRKQEQMSGQAAVRSARAVVRNAPVVEDESGSPEVAAEHAEWLRWSRALVRAGLDAEQAHDLVALSDVLSTPNGQALIDSVVAEGNPTKLRSLWLNQSAVAAVAEPRKTFEIFYATSAKGVSVADAAVVLTKPLLGGNSITARAILGHPKVPDFATAWWTPPSSARRPSCWHCSNHRRSTQGSV